MLEAIVGFDPMDYEVTKEASQFIPSGGYKQFLRIDGLKGKRLGIVRHPFSDLYSNNSMAIPTFEQHLNLLRYICKNNDFFFPFWSPYDLIWSFTIEKFELSSYTMRFF